MNSSRLGGKRQAKRSDLLKSLGRLTGINTGITVSAHLSEC